ncbi:MAG: serpin family protein, partial [Candidatus Electrothrix sp. AUS1_2]|nr:serpin family protein [Candidatus Electrothrix sp. AUS1_2]
NAIYFKGKWDSPFKPEKTAEDQFTLPDGTTREVSMMHRKGCFGYSEIEGAQVLDLPYAGDDLSMLVILPDRPDGLPELEKRLSAENLKTWTARLREENVEVFLPRFTLSWGVFDLRAPLQVLGMRKAFEAKPDGSGADFSGMDGTKIFALGSVLHKAFVEVNEEGTEAVAATAGLVFYGCASPQYRTFRADHPFLFLIRDKATSSILFLGRLLEPGREVS